MRELFLFKSKTRIIAARILILCVLLSVVAFERHLFAVPKTASSAMTEYKMLLQWQFTRGQSKERVRIDSVSENYSAQVLVKFLNPNRCSLTLPNQETLLATCSVPLATSFVEGQGLSMQIDIEERDFVAWLGLGQEFSSVANDERPSAKARRVTLNVWKSGSKTLETVVKTDDEMSSLILRVHAQMILPFTP